MKKKAPPKQLTGRGIYATLAAAALELGTARETLRRRLVHAHVEPRRSTKGRDEYRLRDILVAWYEPSGTDPARLSPFALRALRLAELTELTVRERSGQLVEIAAVRRDYSVMAQKIAMLLGNIPDICERHGAPLAAVLEIEAAVAAARRELVEHLRPTGDADAP